MKLKYVNFLNLSSQCGGQHKCPLASKYSSSCVCNYLYFSLLKPHNITDNNNNNIKNNDDNNYNYNNFNNNYNDKVKALFESSYSACSPYFKEILIDMENDIYKLAAIYIRNNFPLLNCSLFPHRHNYVHANIKYPREKQK